MPIRASLTDAELVELERLRELRGLLEADLAAGGHIKRADVQRYLSQTTIEMLGDQHHGTA